MLPDSCISYFDCLDYVINEMNIGNPYVWSIFQDAHPGGWITFKDYERVARIFYLALHKYPYHG